MWKTTSDTETLTESTFKVKPDNQREVAYSSRWLWDVHETQVGKQKWNMGISESFLKDILPSGKFARYLTPACAQNATSYWYCYTVKALTKERMEKPHQNNLHCFPKESHILDNVNISKFKFCRNKTIPPTP